MVDGRDPSQGTRQKNPETHKSHRWESCSAREAGGVYHLDIKLCGGAAQRICYSRGTNDGKKIFGERSRVLRNEQGHKTGTTPLTTDPRSHLPARLKRVIHGGNDSVKNWVPLGGLIKEIRKRWLVRLEARERMYLRGRGELKR